MTAPLSSSWYLVFAGWNMRGGENESVFPTSAKKPLGIKRIESFISSLWEEVQFCKDIFDLVDGKGLAEVIPAQEFSHCEKGEHAGWRHMSKIRA